MKTTTLTKFKTRILTLVLTIAALAVGQSAWATNTFSITSSTSGNLTTFTITRSGDTSVSETVFYRTVSLSAYAGYNFTENNGELVFDANHNERTVTVSESNTSYDSFKFQVGTTRTYRFEVIDWEGNILASRDRSMTKGTSVQSTAFSKKDLTINSGTITVTDAGFTQDYHSVNVNNYYSATASKDYFAAVGAELRMTITFDAREKDDGYQYVQIYANTTADNSHTDSGSADGDPGSLFYAKYAAGFSIDGNGASTYYSYTFPLTSQASGCGKITNAYSHADLCQQKFESDCRATDGRLIVPTDLTSLYVRLNASGNLGDTWYCQNLVAHIQAVESTAPTKFGQGHMHVSGGRHIRGNTFYVSLPFTEIVTVTGTPTITTSWGTASYVAGSGSNVLTFSGTIDAAIGTTLSVTALSGTVKDLAGNALSSIQPSYSNDAVEYVPWHGTGTSADPYIISSTADLDQLSARVNSDETFSNTYFLQSTDITYSYVNAWNQSSNENNFTAIGGYGKSFRGTYDGGGFTISGLRIYKSGNSTADESQGLFGFVGGGTVRNVVLANSRITGYNNTGGIVGYNSGTIEDCTVGVDVGIYYATSSENHGGIAGINTGGNIRRCTSSAEVTTNYYCGGIVGNLTSGSVTDCLTIDATIFSTFGPYGAIVGGMTDGTITRNYYLNSSVKNSYTNVGVGNSSGNPADQPGARSVHALTFANGVTATVTDGETVVISGQTYYAAGTTFTLSGSSNVDVPEGYSAYEGYTVSYGEDGEIKLGQTGGTFTMPAADATVVHRFTVIPWAGSGTADEPYIIRYASQLDLLAKQVNGTHGYTANNFSGQCFQLGNNITYTHTTDWNDATSTENNYTAIGTSNSFKGTFDGNGHTVSGIRIYSSYDRQGLFGTISSGIVKNVILSDSRITGSDEVGGIVGYSTYSTVQNCHVTNSVTIHTIEDNAGNHGGIVGQEKLQNRIVSCTSAAQLTIVDGKNASCYGGIVGQCENINVIENCISNGVSIPNVNNIGAIVGYKGNGTLVNNYYRNCTVGGATTNVGTKDGDISTNDGAVQVDAVLSETETVPSNLSGKVVFRREFTGGKASTMCLPFAYEKGTEGTYYTFGGVYYDSKWKATMTEYTGATLAANTPYLFVPAGTEAHTPVLFHGTADYDASNLATTSTDWSFVGVYEAKTWTAGDVGNDYGFAATSGKAVDGVTDVEAGDFVKLAEGAWIRPMRSYLTYTGGGNPFAAPKHRAGTELPQSISVILVSANGETTELSEELRVNSEKFATATEWYTLDGRKLDKQPTTKGLYIHNGKKEVVK